MNGGTMNGTPGGPLFLLLFLVLFVIAVFGGNPAKWKLFNFLIILAVAAAGLGVGFLWGTASDNMELGAHMAVPLMYLFGAAAAYVCLRENSRRKALIAEPEPGTVPGGPAKD